jgi:hypothetical protein
MTMLKVPMSRRRNEIEDQPQKYPATINALLRSVKSFMGTVTCKIGLKDRCINTSKSNILRSTLVKWSCLQGSTNLAMIDRHTDYPY